MHPRRTATLAAAPVAVALSLAGATCTPSDPAPSGPAGRLSVTVAPLELPDVGDVAYTIEVRNHSGKTVWREAKIRASDYGDGQGLSYVGTCDASAGESPNTVMLVLDDLYDDLDAVIDPASYQNPTIPTALALTAPCIANRDTAVTFDVTLLRKAGQGFFDVAVEFSDIFCAAKIDCAGAAATDGLLFDPLTNARVPTAVIGLACTAGPKQDTWLYLDHMVLSCGDGDVVLPLDHGPGNLYSVGAPAPPPLVQAAAYPGAEQLTNLGTGETVSAIYFDVALGFDMTKVTRGCALSFSATASDGPFDEPLTTPLGATYPVIELAIDLVAPATSGGDRGAHDGDAPGKPGAFVCSEHALNATPGKGVWTRYTDNDEPQTFSLAAHDEAGPDGDIITLEEDDSGLVPIPHVSGPGGPFLGPDGCLHWTEDVLDGGATVTTTGGTIVGDDRTLVIPAGEPVSAAPVAMCTSVIERTTVITKIDPQTLHLPVDIPEPGCTPEHPEHCPAGDPVETPGRRPGAPAAADPFGAVTPTEPAPGAACNDKMGWSFESGNYAPWQASGNAMANSPVFGNNMQIGRLSPPGYTTTADSDPETNIGGDYWEFSRGANQQGNWWVGTSDLRPSHVQRPGQRLAETETGTLTSPPFIVATAYVDFLIGGIADVSQRVELQVLSRDAADAAELADKRVGIGTVEFPPGYATMPATDPDDARWVIVRSAANLADGEWMGRRVVWAVGAFAGRSARFRVVDAARTPPTVTVCDDLTHCHLVAEPAHVNVDDFACVDAAPAGTTTLVDGAGIPTAAGQVLTPQPIWGTTDAHGHATANLSFGGHLIWGDVADDLESVYQCLQPLPAITDRHGVVVRPEVRDPRSETGCYMHIELISLISTTAFAGCLVATATTGIVPIIGWLASIGVLTDCSFIVGSITAALTFAPVVYGRYYHGAEMPTAGGIAPQDWIEGVAEAVTGSGQEIHGLVEQKDWDLPDGRHSGHGGQLHNPFQHDMIRRAWQGGLRLMVIDVHNGRALQELLDGRDDYDDWQAIADHVAALHRLVAPVGDARWFPGPLRDIAAIAETPAQARAIIATGKLAIVIGSEVGELGKARFAGDSVTQQVEDLYALGVRKITAIHGQDNPLGGSGLFQDIYETADFFNNVTRDENGVSAGEWQPLFGPIPLLVPPSVPFPLGGMRYASWGVFDTLVPKPCADPAHCPWNLENRGYFRLDDTTGDPAGDWIGGRDEVTYRFGMNELKPLHDLSALTSPEELIGHRLYSLGWLLGRGVGGLLPSRRCSLEDMFAPLGGALPPEVLAQYASAYAASVAAGAQGHNMNAVGLRPAGRTFLRAMMTHGMLVDTDHFSQNARLETFELTAAFADEAGLGGSDYPEYPVLGVHTELRGFETGTAFPDTAYFREHMGAESELSKTPAELARMAAAHGLITTSMPGIMHPRGTPEGADRTPGIDLDCNFSSKAYAVKYLLGSQLMGGHGVAPGFDMGGFAPRVVSRYGRGTACYLGNTPERMRGDLDTDGEVPLAVWPQDWQSAAPADCRKNSSQPSGEWNPACPSTQSIWSQLREFSGLIYDDYAAAVVSVGVPFLPPSFPAAGRRLVRARRADQWRDDGAPRSPLDEWVAVGGGGDMAQGRPLVKFRHDDALQASLGLSDVQSHALNTGWDFNLDGMGHIGMLPDLIQDMRNVGVTWEQLGPMFDAAEDYIRMWEQACTIASAWRSAHGVTPANACE